MQYEGQVSRRKVDVETMVEIIAMGEHGFAKPGRQDVS